MAKKSTHTKSGRITGVKEEELIDIKDEEVIKTVKTDETKKEGPIGILDYLNTPNLRLGTDYRKKITFRMDGNTIEGVIRPLSSDEIFQINNTSEMGQGASDKLMVSTAFYGEDGTTRIPLQQLDKFPAGVITNIATEIMTLSGFYIDDNAVSFLKKP